MTHDKLRVRDRASVSVRGSVRGRGRPSILCVEPNDCRDNRVSV